MLCNGYVLIFDAPQSLNLRILRLVDRHKPAEKVLEHDIVIFSHEFVKPNYKHKVADFEKDWVFTFADEEKFPPSTEPLPNAPLHPKVY